MVRKWSLNKNNNYNMKKIYQKPFTETVHVMMKPFCDGFSKADATNLSDGKYGETTSIEIGGDVGTGGIAPGAKGFSGSLWED